MTIEERTKEKKSILMRIFSEISENQLAVASDLIGQAAFMAVTLEDLAESISMNGTVEEYTNGANQCGRKISSDAKLYASLISKYTAVIDKLMKLIPEERQSARIGFPSAENNQGNSYDAKKMKRSSERDKAFFAALQAGKIQQSEYRSFCEEWEKEHI